MSGLATIQSLDRIGSSTDLSSQTWLIPESSAPTDAPPLPIQEGHKKVFVELFGIDGQSVPLSHHRDYATVVYNVDLSEVVGYDPVGERSQGAYYSVMSGALGPPPTYPNQFFDVDVLRAEASSEGVLPQVVPDSNLDDSDLVSARLDELLALGDGYVFRDGMHSPFSRGLVETINEVGVDAFDAIEGRLANDGWPPTVASEAMRWIGDIDSPQTLLRRIELLALGLQHESYVVREGAVLGLMYAESEVGIEVLESALRVETHPLVRLSIEETLDDLHAESS